MARKQAWTDAEYKKAAHLRLDGLAYHEIADELGRTRGSVTNKAHEIEALVAQTKRASVSISEIPSAGRPVGDIIAARREAFQRKKDHHEAKRNVTIKIEGNEPYAIAFFGDPHVDDDGCDLDGFLTDAEKVKSANRCYAINAGDLTNNWIGSLARLWGHQQATEGEGAELAEWVISLVPWLFVILGNHDKWTMMAELKCKALGVQHVSHGCIARVTAGDGRTLTIDARHTHSGHSQYNPAHGQLKRNYRGSPADIIIGAHTHVSAYTMLKNGVSGQIGHCIRLASYKQFDEYADAKGFDDEAISPIVLAVVDPRVEGNSFVTIWHDLDAGLEYLRLKQGK